MKHVGIVYNNANAYVKVFYRAKSSCYVTRVEPVDDHFLCAGNSTLGLFSIEVIYFSAIICLGPEEEYENSAYVDFLFF